VKGREGREMKGKGRGGEGKTYRAGSAHCYMSLNVLSLHCYLSCAMRVGLE